MNNRPLQQNDPYRMHTAAEQRTSDPPKPSLYQQQLDMVLGKPFAAAKFLHEDNFTPAPRPAPAVVCRDTNSIVAASTLYAERVRWFDRIRGMLGKPIMGGSRG